MIDHPPKPEHSCGMLVHDEGYRLDEEVIDVLLHDHKLYGIYDGHGFTGYIYCVLDDEAGVMRWHEEVWTLLGFETVYRATNLSALLDHVVDIYTTDH